MKNFISFISFVMLFVFVISCEKESTKEETVSHNGIEVGRIIQGDFIITHNIPTLKQKWALSINRAPELNVQLTSISIEEDENGLFLYGIDEVNNTKSRHNLILDNNIIYLPTDNIKGSNCSTTCSGCESTGPGSRNECSPSGTGTQTYCTNCTKGTCTKTVTCGGIR